MMVTPNSKLIPFQLHYLHYQKSLTLCGLVLATVPGPSQNRTIAKLVFWVDKSHELSIRVQFDGNLPPCQDWVGCQRVVQQVHL